MHKLMWVFLCALLAFHINCFSQSKSEQIRQLQKIARDNEFRAQKAEEQAEKYNRLAQEAQREAERQRYLSLAVNISRRSLETENSALAGLLALQAYNYNARFKGDEFNGDIYQGLLSALVGFGSGNEKLMGHIQRVRALITKSDMPSLLALEEDGRILRWSNDGGDWEAKELTPKKEGFDILGACVRQDGRLWIIGKKKQTDSRIDIYDVTYSSRKIEGIHEEISQIRFLPETSAFYALSGSRNSIFYCDSQKGREVVQTGEKIVLMDVSRDGSKLMGVTSEGNLYVWDVKKEYSRSVYKIGDDQSRITAITFTPTGRDIIFGNEKGKINLLTVENGVVKKVRAGNFSEIKTFVFSNLGDLIAVVDKLNVVRVWNFYDLSSWPLMIEEGAPISSVTFSADGSEIICATTEKQPAVHVWPLKTEKMAAGICKFLTSNMSTEDWERYVGSVPYETTCPNLPANDR